MTYIATLAGGWLRAHVDAPWRDASSALYRLDGYIGFDRGSHAFVDLVVDSRGDFNEMSSDGRSNDRLVWSQFDNGHVAFRETLTRRDQNDYADEVETLIGGNLTTLDTAHCTRQPTESV